MFEAPTNETRADWAEVALRAFEARAYGPGAGEDDETIAADLVCDLLHFLRLRCEVTDRLRWLFVRLQCHNEEMEEEA